MKTCDFDVVIAGGGLVGGSLACALEGLRVALVEPRAVFENPPEEALYDERIIALAYGSRLILERLGLWPEIAEAANPIRQIHVSDRGHFGFARLHSAEMGLEALGYVVAARHIARAVQHRLQKLRESIVGEVADVRHHPERMEVYLADGRSFTTRLLVAADGGDSPLGKHQGVATQGRDYRQTAVIATVSPQRPHSDIAYERFTDSGPLALLPMPEQRCSLVWTVRSGEETALVEMSEKEFLRALQQRFGWRLGRFERAGARHPYPLHLSHMPQPVQSRLVFIGNAAHTLHPVAGQGLNLGLRDVAALAKILTTAPSGADLGDSRILQRYFQARKFDLKISITLTDTLIKVFSNDFPPLAAARNAGLLGLAACTPGKRLLMRQTTGLAAGV